MPPEPPATEQRLARLLSYLEADPSNETLLLDAIQTALDERAPEQALALAARRPPQSSRQNQYRSLEALAKLQSGRFEEASAAFEALLADSPAEPALLFNAAFARACLKDFHGALSLLDEKTCAALAQAATLRVQVLHQIGEVEAAAEAARSYLTLYPNHENLLAAASVLAIDLEDFDEAQKLSERAPGHPDAMTTLATLALDQGRNVEAMTLFDRVLSINPDKPRALIGRGLAAMLAGQYDDAARDIESGAEKFADHSGSWIGAGWAHLLAQRMDRARSAFEQAIASDRSFSEAHGSLGVLCILQGELDEGRRLTETALRLDPQSFSGVFAQSLLLSGAGKSDQAKAIIARALNTPIDESGATIADALVRFGLRS